MKIAYRPMKLSNKNLEKLGMIASIIDRYEREGYRMTVRQVYYQLVGRDLIPNNLQEYKKVGHLLVEGRMGGVIDWNTIEDRIRIPNIPYSADNIPDALGDVLAQYRLNRQLGQEKDIMVLVEKDALSGVLKKVTYKWHVPLLVNRGYSSQSALHNLYKQVTRSGNPVDIVYVGDHDPSGKDMPRDIESRLLEFGMPSEMLNIETVALNWDQIEKYDLPENPAKLSDPRAKQYIAEFGNDSWELDAIDVKELHRIVDEAIASRVDMAQFEYMMSREKMDKRRLQKMIDDMENDDDEFD